jgi:PDZ domain-containing protein
MNRPEGADNPDDPEDAPASVDAPSGPAGEPGAEEGDQAGAAPEAGDGRSDGHPAGLSPEGGDRPRPPRRRHVGRGVAIAVVLVLVATLITAAFVRVPYYRFSPGSLYATESLVDVEGAPSYPAEGGQIDFTTVSSKKASVLDYYLARFDEAVELRDAAEFEQGKTPEENRQENLEMMVDSKQMAEVAALRKLGYPVQVRGTGALVKAVFKDAEGRDLPAASALHVNDTIVEVDGHPIELGEQAVAAIGSRRAGDDITLKVQSSPGDPGRTEKVTLVSRCAAVKAGECPPGDADKPLLGVRLSNRDTTFDMPVKLSLDTKDVGGPSAGLALTLGIIDVLTPGSLTGGGHIATTGTIDADGNVGPVGGIRQKAHLVLRQRVPLFLVPAGEEAEEAQRYVQGSGTLVVPVKTLDEALNVLREHGGRTDVVAEEAAMRSGTTTPPAPAN